MFFGVVAAGRVFRSETSSSESTPYTTPLLSYTSLSCAPNLLFFKLGPKGPRLSQYPKTIEYYKATASQTKTSPKFVRCQKKVREECELATVPFDFFDQFKLIYGCEVVKCFSVYLMEIDSVWLNWNSLTVQKNLNFIRSRQLFQKHKQN